MKKILCIMIITISMRAFGQIHSIGIQSGLSFTNVKSDYKFDDTKNRTGISFGLNYEITINRKLSIGADVIYSQYGMREKWNLFKGDGTITEIGSYEAKYYFDYIGLPLKLGYTLGSKIKYFVKIGIVPSLLLNGKFIYPITDNSGNMTTNVQNEDIKDNFSKYDLGGLFELGCGYKIQNNFELFSFVSYKESLKRFNYTDSFRHSKLKNYGLAFSLGIKYTLPNK